MTRLFDKPGSVDRCVDRLPGIEVFPQKQRLAQKDVPRCRFGTVSNDYLMILASGADHCRIGAHTMKYLCLLYGNQKESV